MCTNEYNKNIINNIIMHHVLRAKNSIISSFFEWYLFMKDKKKTNTKPRTLSPEQLYTALHTVPSHRFTFILFMNAYLWKKIYTYRRTA